MTKDGAALPIDTAQLVSMMFALLPVPVAITDDRGRVVCPGFRACRFSVSFRPVMPS